MTITTSPGGKAYGLATFGELLTDEGVLLATRSDKWDNATLSSGPAPARLSDGNWLMLYNVDNLWPTNKPKPMPAYGRCALGWAVLDKTD
jgi:hypothetical protein